LASRALSGGAGRKWRGRIADAPPCAPLAPIEVGRHCAGDLPMPDPRGPRPPGGTAHGGSGDAAGHFV